MWFDYIPVRTINVVSCMTGLEEYPLWSQYILNLVTIMVINGPLISWLHIIIWIKFPFLDLILHCTPHLHNMRLICSFLLSHTSARVFRYIQFKCDNMAREYSGAIMILRDGVLYVGVSEKCIR